MDMIVKSESLTSVADAIRTKGETTEQLVFPDDFAAAIMAIQSGGAYPQLIVTAPVGSTIAAVNGDDTVTGEIGAEETLTLDLPAFGEWTVTATLDGQEASASIYIEQEHSLELAYDVTLTIHGGHNETVTISGGGMTPEPVMLDSNGTGAVTLNGVAGKTLTFTGGMSGYEKVVTVGASSEMTVNVYPDGALYWYGREFEDITGGWVAFTKDRIDNTSYWRDYTAGFAKNANSIQLKSVVDGARRCSCGNDIAIPRGNYTTLEINVTNLENGTPYSVAANVILSNSAASSVAYREFSKTGVVSIPLTDIDVPFHVVPSATAEGSGSSQIAFNEVVLK